MQTETLGCGEARVGKNRKGKYRSNANSNGKRYTLEEKEYIKQRFLELGELGKSVNDSLKELRVSQSTLYRWFGERAPAEQPSHNTVIAANRAQAAIEKLLGSPKTENDTLRALFEVIFWLRWPNNIKDHATFISSCFVSYYLRDSGCKKLSELSSYELKTLAREIEVEAILNIFSRNGYDPPMFIYNEFHNEREFLATIGNYFIYHASIGQYRSIRSIADFVQKDDFHPRSVGSSETTLRKLWRSGAAAMPFLYVEIFHPTIIRWDIDPSSAGFRQEIDELLQNPDQIYQYFCRCKWAVHQFSKRMDKRAFQRLQFPLLPEWLPEEALVVKAPG